MRTLEIILKNIYGRTEHNTDFVSYIFFSHLIKQFRSVLFFFVFFKVLLLPVVSSGALIELASTLDAVVDKHNKLC